MKIDKDIPIPAKQVGRRRHVAWSMQPGDSVLVKKQVDTAHFHTVLRRRGYTSTVRTVEGGYRVWCVALGKGE